MDGDQRRWWTLAVLSLSLLVIGLDNTILNVAIPTLQREFAASAAELQWMVDAYVVVFAGLLLTFGALGDRFGRARALQAGLVIFGLASLASAYAQSAGQLIAARAVMGVGGAFIMPATLSIISAVFPREERGRAIAIWSGVAGLGVGLGPLAGGLLLESFWWGSVFLINVPVVLVALAAGVKLVPESRDPEPSRLDLVGAALSIAAVAILVYTIIEAPAHGWLDPLVLTGFAVAAFLSAAFIFWERRITHPLLDLDLFRNPRFAVGAGAVAIAFFALFGSIFALTQYLQFVRGYTALEAGVRLLPIALGIVIGAGGSYRLVRRFGTRVVITGGMTALAAALAGATLWSPTTDYWILGLTIFLIALAMGNVMAPATDAVMGAVPEAKAGVGSAMNDVTRQVGGALGVAVIGSALTTAYANQMGDAVAGLPPPAAAAARDSLGAALRIAAQLGGPPGEVLTFAARTAFVDALGIATLVGAVTALVGAALVAWAMPARHREPAEAPTATDGAARPGPMAGRDAPGA